MSSSTTIHFTTHTGTLVRDALEEFVEKQEAMVAEAETDGEAAGRRSYAAHVGELVEAMKQAVEPGDWGHWELRWCDRER